MNKKTASEVLAANVKLLLTAHVSIDTQVKLAQKSGLGQSSISRVLKGNTQPTTETVEKLAGAFGIATEQLMSPQLSRGLRETIEGNSPLVGSRRLPLIDYTHAMAWPEAMNATIGAQRWVITDMELSENAFALEIQDDSTGPEFKKGEVLIIDPVSPRSGDYVIAKAGDRKPLLSKYRSYGFNKEGVEVFEITPVDPDEPPTRSDFFPIEIIGVMMEHRRLRRKP